jgi:Tfp pilus assembly protein PilF
MIRRSQWLVLILALLVSACRPPAMPDPLRSGRQHLENGCVGADRDAQAVADLEAALQADPDRLEAYYWLFVAHTRLQDSEAAAHALADLEAAVEEGRGGPEGQFWLLLLYGERGDGEAQSDLLAAMERAAGSEDAEARLWLGRAYYGMGQPEQAFESLQMAAAMDPEQTLAHFWLGYIYTEQGQLDLADEEFTAVLELDPDNAAAYHNRGRVAYQIGEPDQAAADLEAALERDPDDPRSHYQLGATYLIQALPMSPFATPDADLLGKARSEFETALDLCPGMPEPLIGLGNLHLVEGRPTAALESLQQAVEQVPDSPEAWFALGQVYSSLGQVEAACDALDRFLSLSPPPEWRSQAEDMRAQLACR